MSEEKTLAMVPASASSTGSEMSAIFLDESKFRMVQRAANMFALSPLVPEHLRGKTKDEGIANCVIALAMALEMHENPLIVMQNLYVVHGRAGWQAQYMIARANASGVFSTDLDWEERGKGDSMEVECFATRAKDGKRVSFTASMQLARDEGWAKNNPKYRTMPGLMLRYRSAAILVRLYAPGVMLGYHTVEELIDVDGSPRPRQPITVKAVEVVVPEAPQAAEPPPWISALHEATAAYAERHQGVLPDWLPEDVLDAGTAGRLLDRFAAEEEADREREALAQP